MFCVKCGTEVPEGYEFCMKCGSKIEPTQEINIGEPKKKAKKWIIPIIIVAVVAILAVVTTYFMKDSQKRNGLYNNIAWETSYEKIKTMIQIPTGKDDPLISKDNSIAYELLYDYKGDKNITAMVSYDCQDDDTLHKVSVVITNGDESKYTDDKLYDKYASELTALYGESEENLLGKKWTTKKSQISLVYFHESMIIVMYEDIKTVED